MKRFSTPVLIVFIILLSVSLTMAGNATIVDDILLIPKTGEEPTIDGNLDPVWNMVTATPMLYHEGRAVTNVWDTIGVYDDHYSSFRTMWDEDYLYVFVQVVDEELDGSERTSPWLNDCVELFFDGGNEKAATYDSSDVQWRWVYGEEPGDTSNVSNDIGEWAWNSTAVGYNFEIRISADSLATIYFPLEEEQEIGFEVSNADRDNGDRDGVLHWWTTDGNTWQNASLFGTAALVAEEELSDVLLIPFASDEPTIDGTFDEDEGWDVASEISLTRVEGDPEPAPDTIWADWTDHLSSALTMWDEDYFYVFVKVIDEELDGSERTSPWLNDCIELFFDGGNEKTATYDSSDVQWRWVYGEEPGDTSNVSNDIGEWAFLDTDIGYNFELKISADSLATIYLPLTNEHELGFEISNADRDNSDRDDVLHWWTNDGNTWQNATLFGTAVLVGGPTAIGDNHSVLSGFKLGQNYPNPFNPSTKIVFSLDKTENVKLTIYNLLGQQIAVLVDGTRIAGQHIVEFNGANLPSGIYFYSLEAGDQVFTNKMMLIK